MRSISSGRGGDGYYIPRNFKKAFGVPSAFDFGVCHLVLGQNNNDLDKRVDTRRER